MQGGEGARAFGPALDALLTYLGAPGASAAGLARLAASAGGAAAAGPRFPCVRVLAFVSGPPDAGAGALEGARWADAAPMLFPPGSSGTPTPAVLEAAMAAADALAAPQTEFYAEAGARAAVRAGVLSRCDCALMLHLAARALCAHASRARTGGRHCGGRVCAASCRRRGLPGPGIAGAAPSRLRRRAAALPARPRRCAAAARRAPHPQARACWYNIVACFGCC